MKDILNTNNIQYSFFRRKEIKECKIKDVIIIFIQVK